MFSIELQLSLYLVHLSLLLEQLIHQIPQLGKGYFHCISTIGGHLLGSHFFFVLLIGGLDVLSPHFVVVLVIFDFDVLVLGDGPFTIFLVLLVNSLSL